MRIDERQSREFDALLNILKGKEVDTNSINTGHLVQLAHDHRIISPVCSGYQNNDELKAILDQAYLNNKLHQLKLVSEIRVLDTILSDINWLLLKGPGLSQLIYDDPGERTSKDIDVLIHPDDFDTVLDRLRNNGYNIQTFFNSPKQKKAVLKFLHDVELYTPSNEVIIELHWKLFSSPVDTLGTEIAIKNRSFVKLSNNNYETLCLNDQIIYLCVHGARHGFFRLQWLYDIHRIFQLHADVFNDLIISNLKNPSVLRPLICSLLLCEKAFDFKTEIVDDFRHRKEYLRIVNFCWTEILENDSFVRPRSYSGPRRTWRNHRLNYLLGGCKMLWKSLITRNVRPNNWKIFAFPDPVFFLNHVLSRFIWMYGRISGKLNR